MSIQLVIILIYFAVTVGVGMYAKKKSTSSNSFHGIGLGILMCVAAGTGEWLGGTSTTGVSEYGYLFGLSGSWYTIANGIGVIVLAIFFAKLYRSLGTVAIPGIIEKYIGKNARVVSSILLTFVMIAVGTAQIIALIKISRFKHIQSSYIKYLTLFYWLMQASKKQYALTLSVYKFRLKKMTPIKIAHFKP